MQMHKSNEFWQKFSCQKLTQRNWYVSNVLVLDWLHIGKAWMIQNKKKNQAIYLCLGVPCQITELQREMKTILEWKPEFSPSVWWGRNWSLCLKWMANAFCGQVLLSPIRHECVLSCRKNISSLFLNRTWNLLKIIDKFKTHPERNWVFGVFNIVIFLMIEEMHKAN